MKFFKKLLILSFLIGSFVWLIMTMFAYWDYVMLWMAFKITFAQLVSQTVFMVIKNIPMMLAIYIISNYWPQPD